MKSSLLLALAPFASACAGAEPAPQAPAAPPVVVDLSPPPAPAAPKAASPGPEPAAEAKPAEIADADKKEPEEEFGMIGLLNSGAGGDPNAPTAPWGKDDPLSARGNMWGNDVGESFGAGGLGLSGIGPGGGGKGEGIGLGGIGVLGHGAGTGQGFGSGHGRLGGSNRAKPPQVRMGATSVSGRLPPEVIQRIVRQNFGRFRLCYENGLRSKPTLQGRVSVKFVIDRSGAVESVANGGSDLPDAGVVSCVTRAFHGLSFPQPELGKVVVVYPIMFSPGEAARPPPSGTKPIDASSTAPTPPPKPAASAKKP